MDQDPYQPDASGVTDHYAAHHQSWKPIAYVVGGRMLGAYDERHHPVRFKIVSTIILIGVVIAVAFLIHAGMTDPRNTPLPVPQN